MAGTIKRIAGPAFLASSATNVYTPPASTILTTIRHMHFANVTAGAVTFSLYVGATGGSAAGTEVFKDYSIAAKGILDWYGAMAMASTDFLTGISTASSITITVEGEQSVV